MEIIVANEENWKNHELSTKDCPKIKISCEKIAGQFIIEVGKKQKPDEKTIALKSGCGIMGENMEQV